MLWLSLYDDDAIWPLPRSMGALVVEAGTAELVHSDSLGVEEYNTARLVVRAKRVKKGNVNYPLGSRVFRPQWRRPFCRPLPFTLA